MPRGGGSSRSGGGGFRGGGFGNYNTNIKSIGGAGVNIPRGPMNRPSSTGMVTTNMKVNATPPMYPTTKASSPMITGGYLNKNNNSIAKPKGNKGYYYPSQNINGKYDRGWNGKGNRYPYNRGWNNRYWNNGYYPYGYGGYWNNNNLANYSGSYPWYSYLWYPWYNWLNPPYYDGNTYVYNNNNNNILPEDYPILGQDNEYYPDYSNDEGQRLYEMEEFGRGYNMHSVLLLIALIIIIVLLYNDGY